MRFHGLDLNLLLALDALLTEKNVTLAAQKVHLSQSAMSSALGRLRSHLGDPLLVQSGRTMVPTLYGEALARGVRDILLQVDATLNARPSFDPRTSKRHFAVAASDYAVIILLLEVQRRMDQLAPQASLEVQPITLSTVASLQRGEIDFVVIPDRYRFESCPCEVLFHDQMVCIAARDNPRVKQSITMDQFVALDHVTFQPDPGHVIAFDEWLREHYDVQPAVKVAMPNYSLLPLAVVGTGRIATVPARLAEFYCRSLPLRIVVPEFEMPPMIELLQWHRSRADDTGLAWLRRVIAEVATEVDAPLSSTASQEGPR